MTLATDLEISDALCRREAKKGYLNFLSQVVINSVPPRRFVDIADPWQWEMETQAAPALERLAGFPSSYDGPRWFWEGMPRGHDKTSRQARRLLWLLGFSKRRLKAIHIAGDDDQAHLLLQCVDEQLLLNPWIPCKANKHEQVYGPGGTLYVLAADGASNYGYGADCTSCDELTNWKGAKGEANWAAIRSGSEKRGEDACLFLATNAGTLGSWQREVRNNAEAGHGKFWNFLEVPEYQQWASWMSADRIAEMRKDLPPGEAKRVIDNVWIDPSEECGYMTRAEVQRCVDLGIKLGLYEKDRGESQFHYWMSLDWGKVRDRATCGIYHRDHETGIIIADRLDVFQGSPANPIKIGQMDVWIEQWSEAFFVPDLLMDPYQMIGLGEKYETSRKVVLHEPRGGKANFEMAEALRTMAISEMLAWYPGCGRLQVANKVDDLSDEIANLVVRKMSYGYRFDHEANKHDDRAVNVGMGILGVAPDWRKPWVKPTNVNKERTPLLAGETKDKKRIEPSTRRGIWGM